MSNIDIKKLKVAKKYSDALFENAQDSNKVQDTLNELNSIATILGESPDLNSFLVNPVISINDKLEVVVQVMASTVSDTVLNFIKLLIENSRFDAFQAVIFEYQNRVDEVNNVLKVDVISAVKLDEHMKTKLIEKLQYKTSKNVILNYSIKPEIIAGLIIKVNDKTIDTSLKTKLGGIKRQLI